MNVEERLNAIITQLQRSVPVPFDPPRDWLTRKATVMYLQELTDRIESMQKALQLAGLLEPEVDRLRRVTDSKEGSDPA
jgi:hypothetical protein